MPQENIIKKFNPADAIAQIKAIEQQTFQGGNVDSEKEQFESILEDLKTNKISPEEALNKVNLLTSKRQDYH
jgi:hypothetical protein